VRSSASSLQYRTHINSFPFRGKLVATPGPRAAGSRPSSAHLRIVDLNEALEETSGAAQPHLDDGSVAIHLRPCGMNERRHGVYLADSNLSESSVAFRYCAACVEYDNRKSFWARDSADIPQEGQERASTSGETFSADAILPLFRLKLMAAARNRGLVKQALPFSTRLGLANNIRINDWFPLLDRSLFQACDFSKGMRFWFSRPFLVRVPLRGHQSFSKLLDYPHWCTSLDKLKTRSCSRSPWNVTTNRSRRDNCFSNQTRDTATSLL